MLVPVARILNLKKDRKRRDTPAYLAAFQSLAEDMRLHGIRTALKGYWTTPAKEWFQLVCGQTRLNAARLLGIAEAPVVELTGDLSVTRTNAEEYVDNNHGEEFDIVAVAELVTEIMAEQGWTQTELCENIPAFKPSKVSKALSVFDGLIDELKVRVRASEIGGRMAYALARLPQDRQAEMYQQFGVKKVEVVEAKVAEMLGKRPKAKAKPQTVKHEGVTVTFLPTMTRDQVIEACRLAAKKIA